MADVVAIKTDSSLHVLTETYGALKANLHIAGYTFELASRQVEKLLDGDGWKLGGRFIDVNVFLDSLQLDKLRAAADKRKSFCKRVKELQPDASNRQIAKTLGVSHETVNKDVGNKLPLYQEKFNENKGEKVVGGNLLPPSTLSGSQSAQLIARREARRERDQAASEKIDRQIVVGAGTAKMLHGDFRGVLADLRNVDAIITDPPYGSEWLPLLRDLAELSDKMLKPEGIMAVLFGQTYLMDAIKLLSGFRPYRWMACYLTKGNGYVSHARAIQSNWKPILIYGGNSPRFADVIETAGDSDGKDRHEWGQNFDAFKALIERLTSPGATVVDPFAGGGTTLLAAKAAGRHAIGCDINKEYVDLVQQQISNPRPAIEAAAQ